MYSLYSFLLLLGLTLAAPYFLWRGRSDGRYLKTFRARLAGAGEALNRERRPAVWIHAVSVGEALVARSLVAPLRERLPGHPVFVSTITVTGQAAAQRYADEVDGVFFAPFDWGGPVRRTLEHLNPRLLVLVDTELWPNMIHEARRSGARVVLVNGRISPRSYPGYKRFKRLLAPVLADVDLFLMQGPANAERVIAIGAPPARVRVAGSLKFDALVEPRPPEVLARMFGEGDAPVFLAGSTVEGEEPLVLEAYRRVLERWPTLTLILAPRHPERFAPVGKMVEAHGLDCVARSTLSEAQSWRGGRVLLLDTLGELAHSYPLATVAFVGGSLMPAGGHNILEAAAAGKPVIVGPHMENFQEIADAFLEKRALIQVDSAESLADEIARLLQDDAARQEIGERALEVVAAGRGALERTVASLARLLA